MNESIAIRPGRKDTSFVSPAPPAYDAGEYYSTLAYDTLYHSPTGTLGLFGGPEGSIGRGFGLYLESHDSSSALMSVEELNELYGIEGELKFDEPTRQRAARIVHERKLAEIRRNQILGSEENSLSRKIISFPVSMAVSLVDPVNLAASFVPVVGQSRFLRGLEGTTRLSRAMERGLISPKTIQRITQGGTIKTGLLRGAVEGGVGYAAIEPLIAIPEIYEQADYDASTFAAGVFAGTAIGTFLGGLAGGLARVGRSVKAASAQTHEAALLSAVKDLAEDKPITSPSTVALSDKNVVSGLLSGTHPQNILKIAEDFVLRIEHLSKTEKIPPDVLKKYEEVKFFLDNPNPNRVKNIAKRFDLEPDEKSKSMPPQFSHLSSADEHIELPGLLEKLRESSEDASDEGDFGVVDTETNDFNVWKRIVNLIYGHNGEIKFTKINDLSDTKRFKGEPRKNRNIIVMVSATIGDDMVATWSQGHMRYGDGGHLYKRGKWLREDYSDGFFKDKKMSSKTAGTVEEPDVELTKTNVETAEVSRTADVDVTKPFDNSGTEVAAKVSEVVVENARKELEAAKPKKTAKAKKTKTVKVKDTEKRNAVSEDNADKPVKSEPTEVVKDSSEVTQDLASLREEVRALEQDLKNKFGLDFKSDPKEEKVPQFEMPFVKEVLEEVKLGKAKALEIKSILDTARPCILKKQL